MISVSKNSLIDKSLQSFNKLKLLIGFFLLSISNIIHFYILGNDTNELQ